MPYFWSVHIKQQAIRGWQFDKWHSVFNYFLTLWTAAKFSDYWTKYLDAMYSMNPTHFRAVPRGHEFFCVCLSRVLISEALKLFKDDRESESNYQLPHKKTLPIANPCIPNIISTFFHLLVNASGRSTIHTAVTWSSVYSRRFVLPVHYPRRYYTRAYVSRPELELPIELLLAKSVQIKCIHQGLQRPKSHLFQFFLTFRIRV